MKNKIAVIGAGNGGQAIAGHMALSGHQVWIYDIDAEKIAEIQKKGDIALKGEEFGSTRNIQATGNLEEAVKNAEILMIVTPANAHQQIAKEMAPYLEDAQIIILNPGYFLGALCFNHGLKKGGCEREIVVADTESLIYACRSEVPGEVYISGIKNSVLVATFPGKKIHVLMGKVNKIYPQFRPAENILETSFGNVNPILHQVFSLDRVPFNG